VAGGVCLATGVGWAFIPEIESFGLFLLALSFLGASAVAAAGWWQLVAGPETRVFVLVLLAALSGGYVASNVIGLLVVGEAGHQTAQVGGIVAVRILLAAGLLTSVALYVASLAAVIPALRDRAGAVSGP
jgi:hypothetical protein